MAQIVCIDTGTLNTEVNAIDDIVEIQDDNVELTGSGYELMKIIRVEGKNKFAIDMILNNKRPEQKRAVRIPEVGKWGFMEEKEVWKNADEKWCDLISRPKYAFSMADVTTANRLSLADKEVAISTKNVILDKIIEKIHLGVNNLIEVADLNPVVAEL